jgi:hypothetical protein
MIIKIRYIITHWKNGQNEQCPHRYWLETYSHFKERSYRVQVTTASTNFHIAALCERRIFCRDLLASAIRYIVGQRELGLSLGRRGLAASRLASPEGDKRGVELTYRTRILLELARWSGREVNCERNRSKFNGFKIFLLANNMLFKPYPYVLLNLLTS